MAHERVRSILVATDLGEGSDEVVATAASLAAAAGAELHTIHSLQLPWTPNDDVMRRTGFFEQIADAEGHLHEQGLRVLGGRKPPTTEVVVIYVAHRAILDRAHRVNADLIVLGSHRGGPRKPLFLGTTADHVVRLASIPCLVVGDQAHFPVSRIGVATDFSESAGAAFRLALDWVADLAASPGGEPGFVPDVRLVHIAHPMILAGDPDLARAIQEQMSHQIEETEASRSGETPTRVLPEVLWHAEPSDALTDWVRDTGIELLVMGTHGGGFLERALIGSLATSMARLTPCPVLLVPPPPGATDGAA